MGIFDAKPVAPEEKPESIVRFIPVFIFMLPGAFIISVLTQRAGRGWAGVLSTMIAIFVVTAILTLIYKLIAGRWRTAAVIIYLIVLFVFFVGSRK